MEQFIEDQYNENTRKKTQQNAEKSSLSHVSECPTTTVHSVSSAADYQQGQRAISISVLLFMVANSTSLSAALINHRPLPLQKLRISPQRGTKD